VTAPKHSVKPALLPHQRTWEVLPGRSPAVGELLRLGSRAVPLGDIRGFVASADKETDRKPALVTLAVFGVVALFFLFGVLDIGWRTRFLAATCLFGFIAVSALNDIAWMTQTGLYRVDVLTARGETICFTTVDEAEQATLIATLGGIVGRNGVVATAMPVPTSVATVHPSRVAAA
jgi:hypothetical protein